MTDEQLAEKINLVIENLEPIIAEWSNEESRPFVEQFFTVLEKFIASFWYMTKEMEKQ